ncbi:hypothetical protein P5673_024509 [Acropora cervicornis]|uniref:Uncharacterized protein n=1 Tax=Acropora cervicornis TaxID=6130 RepID=A0AAD9Q417_ACRCE|nr:hypothetical protein P5673_024509 [Acropora cervicornis]
MSALGSWTPDKSEEKANDVEENPGPTIFDITDPMRTVSADYSQGNEALFGENAGKQCVAMSLTAIIYHQIEQIQSKENCCDTAYHFLVRWIFGPLGWNNSRPLPAHVYHKIRQNFLTASTRGHSSADQRQDDAR